MPAAIHTGLERRGHAVHGGRDLEPGWGPVSLITQNEHMVRGVADPRVSTASACVG
jgi:hypothetical protein